MLPKVEIHIPASVLKFDSVCCICICDRPLPSEAFERFCVLQSDMPFFNPKCPNATSTKARLPAPPPSLEAVAVNLVKVHLHHVDPAAG